MDMTQYAVADNNDLKAADFIGVNMKVVIDKVDTVHYDATNDQPETTRAVIYLVGKEKRIVLNPTNTKTLCEAYGSEDDGWIGHEIGLTVKEYDTFKPGWIVTPLDVKAPDFDDDIEF